MTYCSTAFSVINCGLKPVLVDIAKNMSCIDVDKIEKKITKNTKVIMPVHLYGSVADLKSIKKIIKKSKRKIYLIDDCSQAHGAIDATNDLKKLVQQQIYHVLVYIQEKILVLLVMLELLQQTIRIFFN